MKNNSALSYDDVLLSPQYSEIRSRSEISTVVDLNKGLALELPLLASPMDTVSEASMAAVLSEYGGAAVIHRYNTTQQQVDIVIEARNASSAPLKIGVAIGVTGDYITRAAVMIALKVDFLCVDIAHGHHVLMKEALKTLRERFGNQIHIMAGNVATLEGVNDLSDWGADSVRCNIGGGSICSTRVQTGHGVPGLQTIMDCAQTDRDVKIIADGGIRNSGDIVKALAAGADAVMCGSLFAGTDEAPGKVLQDKEGHRWKVYRGMASKEAQVDWRGKYSSHEGVSATIPYRGPASAILDELKRGISSGFSYSGARSLTELQARAKFVTQTVSGLSEGHTHILGRKW
tara:strand:- start:1226 stop:2260 length:1035 start_codon:yes stop_codon:yes gene_type:complete